jgi:hypothetical protein
MVGGASVGASPRGLLHPWKPVVWLDSQEAEMSLNMR